VCVLETLTVDNAGQTCEDIDNNAGQTNEDFSDNALQTNEDCADNTKQKVTTNNADNTGRSVRNAKALLITGPTYEDIANNALPKIEGMYACICALSNLDW
jgi:hypothetical protein